MWVRRWFSFADLVCPFAAILLEASQDSLIDVTTALSLGVVDFSVSLFSFRHHHTDNVEDHVDGWRTAFIACACARENSTYPISVRYLLGSLTPSVLLFCLL